MSTKAFLIDGVLQVWQNGRILYEMPVEDDPDALELSQTEEIQLEYKAGVLASAIGHVLDTAFVEGVQTLYSLGLGSVTPRYAYGRHYLLNEVIGLGQDIFTAKQDFWAEDPKVDYEPVTGENDYFKRWTTHTPNLGSDTYTEPIWPIENPHNALIHLGLEKRFIQISNHSKTYSAESGMRAGIVEYMSTRDPLSINTTSFGGAPLSANRLWTKIMEYKTPEDLSVQSVIHHGLGIAPLTDLSQLLVIAPHWVPDRSYFERRAFQHEGHLYQVTTRHTATKDTPKGLPPSQNSEYWTLIY